MKTKSIEMVLRHIRSPAKEDVQDMINQVDVDGSGVCRFPEFLDMMAGRVGQIKYLNCMTLLIFIFILIDLWNFSRERNERSLYCFLPLF